MKTSPFVQVLREASPYIHQYRDETFVVLLNHRVMQSASLEAIVHDFALLQSLGIRLVICFESHNREEITPTPTTLLNLSQIQAQCGIYRSLLEALFSTSLPNTPMANANLQVVSGNFVTAKPTGIIDGVDYQHTGKPRKIDNQGLSHLLDHKHIVLLPDLAYSTTGECFYVPIEAIGTAAAKALRATKLLTFTDEQSLTDIPNQLVLSDAQALYVQQPSLALHQAILSSEEGIPRSQIVNHEKDGALLTELFSIDGCGSLITQNPFETIENATIDDVGGIMALIKPLEEKGVLVKRERERLEQEINDFIVIKRDDCVLATAALYPHDNQMAEIACVATHPNYQGDGRAASMLEFLEKRAKQQDIQQLFVLTTQSAHFFIEHGFKKSSVDALPQTKQSFYNLQRNSCVFTKQISE
ncbi:MAG: amino-acid N-acetyltransferase [Cellvibrionales bacterium]|nr:amino-acid N-acetyltransferase [Cellvibrionales bacterium]